MFLVTEPGKLKRDLFLTSTEGVCMDSVKPCYVTSCHKDWSNHITCIHQKKLGVIITIHLFFCVNWSDHEFERIGKWFNTPFKKHNTFDNSDVSKNLQLLYESMGRSVNKYIAHNDLPLLKRSHYFHWEALMLHSWWFFLSHGWILGFKSFNNDIIMRKSTSFGSQYINYVLH